MVLPSPIECVLSDLKLKVNSSDLPANASPRLVIWPSYAISTGQTDQITDKMAMAGGAKIEVLAFGEVEFENDKISFTLGILGTSEQFRHSKSDNVMTTH